MKTLRTLAVAAITTCAICAAWAQTTVADAWVRGTVAQQKATGLFATITSTTGGKLVGASSPVAGTVEIHEMKMDGDTMRMRAVAALDLPAGKAVELKPGGYHVMLIDLQQVLKAGDTVPLKLIVEGADKQRTTIDVTVPVRTLAARPMEGHQHDMGKK